MVALDGFDEINAAGGVERNVHNYQVRRGFADAIQSAGGIRRVTANRQIRLQINQPPESVAEHRMVIFESWVVQFSCAGR